MVGEPSKGRRRSRSVSYGAFDNPRATIFSPVQKLKKIISTTTVLAHSVTPTTDGGLAHDPGVDLSKEHWKKNWMMTWWKSSKVFSLVGRGSRVTT
jgi:hypothetical protein